MLTNVHTAATEQCRRKSSTIEAAARNVENCKKVAVRIGETGSGR